MRRVEFLSEVAGANSRAKRGNSSLSFPVSLESPLSTLSFQTLGAGRLMAAAMQAAPKPLSMFTTASPGAQLLIMPKSAA